VIEKENKDLNRDRLKPYVFKVEGANGFALYNMHSGEFYHFSNEGSIEELRKTLLKEGLIFETKGIVPSKIMKLDIPKLKNKIFLRELQIRINGKGEDNCWKRGKNETGKKYMKYMTLKLLQDSCQYIPIQRVRIEAEEYENDKIEMVLQEFKYESLELYIENAVDQQHLEYLAKKYIDKKIILVEDGRKKITEQRIEVFGFLYSQYFNPCLGHKAAVDANGDIKCCLWSDHILGNIETDDLKKMIIRGDFDLYWESHKMKIESCKDCELRFVCDDCRVDVLKKGAEFYAKPFFCEYDPYKGV